jgi:hypothetical protein
LFEEPADPMVPGCEACELPFFVLEDLKRVAAPHHHVLIDDCATHFKSYMSYQMRAGNARAGILAREVFYNIISQPCISKLFDTCGYPYFTIAASLPPSLPPFQQAEQTEEDVVEQLDYMMTFQALYGLETTVNFFGKRGMLLHGTEAHFQTVGGKRDTHYFSHISMHDMKQDWRTVLALFESKLRMLKEIKPNLKRVREIINPPPSHLHPPSHLNFEALLVRTTEQGH